ncbi:MAG: hypothetical protein ABIQ59_00930 [Nocardioidaceae bacterium]
MSGSSPRRRARRRRSARRLLLLALVLAVTAGVVYAGIRDRPTGDVDAARPSPSPSSTPSSSVDLSQLPIERGSFCDQLDERNVEAALDSPVSDTSHYDSGDRVVLAPGVTDVSHEYDCTFSSADGTEARVWVFAEPVTAAVGRTIVRDARAEKGCTVRPDPPTFGTPSVATACRTTKPAARTVTLRGLFGDAWLSCRLSTPGATAAAETIQRADQWCVRVATTLGARP